MEKASILVVESNLEVRDRLVHALKNNGFFAWGCPLPDTARDLLATVHPQILLIDLDLQEEAGWDLLRVCKQNSPETRVILHSSSLNTNLMVKAVTEGADGFFMKSFSAEPILSMTGLIPPLRH